MSFTYSEVWYFGTNMDRLITDKHLKINQIYYKLWLFEYDLEFKAKKPLQMENVTV